jgi:pyruvate,water dikinase
MGAEILVLGSPACHDVALVGGKTANLSRLASRFRVPPGFCVTTNVSTMSPDLSARIGEAYRDLGVRCGTPDPSVAVRSSAADEDGATASFAGQHDTYLNIAGVDAVVDAVVRCWESARTDRAIDYRVRQGLDTSGVRLAVLVQQLVRADTAAVVFSANPVSSSRDEIVINASWGLGESIVGGTVTPDTFVVSKRDASIVRQIADKARMTIATPNGTREVDVPRFMRTTPSIDDEQVREAANLATALEAVMGWPVDIECAFADGLLYLLQCRPITTLEGAPR